MLGRNRSAAPRLSALCHLIVAVNECANFRAYTVKTVALLEVLPLFHFQQLTGGFYLNGDKSRCALMFDLAMLRGRKASCAGERIRRLMGFLGLHIVTQ